MGKPINWNKPLQFVEPNCAEIIAAHGNGDGTYALVCKEAGGRHYIVYRQSDGTIPELPGTSPTVINKPEVAVFWVSFCDDCIRVGTPCVTSGEGVGDCGRGVYRIEVKLDQ